jgi:hypothetical protein
MLGLLVGVRLDIPAVGCDNNEPRMGAVIQAFDELALGFSVGIIIRGMCYLRIEYGGEFIARAEPLPTGWSHTNDVVRALRADVTNRVQPVLRVVAFNTNLMFRGTPNRCQFLGVGRAMLLVMLEIILLG